MRKILFVDRDGTIIEEPEDFQIDSLEKLRFVPGAILGLKKFQDLGFPLVLVSNQDGLGTTSFPKKAFQSPHDSMLHTLASCGIQFDAIRICPHFSDEACRCRKPGIGLLDDFLEKGYDRNFSLVIGDRDSDIKLAENLGVKGYRLDDDWTWQKIFAEHLLTERKAQIIRETKETQVSVSVNLDNQCDIEVKSSLGIMDHLLTQLAFHGGFSLKIRAEGDTHIDDHHLVEDLAITLGQALKKALGDKFGIGRYGFYIPMDETLAFAALDLSGRPSFEADLKFPTERLGQIQTEMIPHFFSSLCLALGMSLHVQAEGKNSHHIAEALFKALGKSLKKAFTKDFEKLPSTKGLL